MHAISVTNDLPGHLTCLMRVRSIEPFSGEAESKRATVGSANVIAKAFTDFSFCSSGVHRLVSVPEKINAASRGISRQGLQRYGRHFKQGCVLGMKRIHELSKAFVHNELGQAC